MKKLVEQSEEKLLDGYLGKHVLIHGAMYHFVRAWFVKRRFKKLFAENK